MAQLFPLYPDPSLTTQTTSPQDPTTAIPVRLLAYTRPSHIWGPLSVPYILPSLTQLLQCHSPIAPHTGSSLCIRPSQDHRGWRDSDQSSSGKILKNQPQKISLRAPKSFDVIQSPESIGYPGISILTAVINGSLG